MRLANSALLISVFGSLPSNICCQHTAGVASYLKLIESSARVCATVVGGITLPLPLPLLDYLTDEICGVKRKRTTHFRHLLCTAGTPTHLAAPRTLEPLPIITTPAAKQTTPAFYCIPLRLTTPSHHIAPQKWPTWTSTSRAATRSRACSPTASGTSWTSLSTQSTTPRGKQSSPSSPPCCYLCLSAR